MEALPQHVMAQPKSRPNACRWVTQSLALRHFATFKGRTQSQLHIKPLHWYVACRLVLEGGFRPDELQPKPPFSLTAKHGEYHLKLADSAADGSEATVLGGLKTKNVDVVVNKPGIGPVLAVSCKGITGAYRNLTNRMEEMIGECTNLHITYPALVLGYFFLARGNPLYSESEAIARQLAPNDIALTEDGEPHPSIARYHAALSRLVGRRGIRNDISAYEAAAFVLVDTRDGSAGQILSADFPNSESELGIEQCFNALYQRYDERFVYAAPELKHTTGRLTWTSVPSVNQADGDSDIGYRIRLRGAA